MACGWGRILWYLFPFDQGQEKRMIEIDRVDRIIAKIKEKQAPDHITWRMELDDEIKEKLHAKRTTYN